jgi:DNA-binding GntR family transcriptional regulator
MRSIDGQVKLNPCYACGRVAAKNVATTRVEVAVTKIRDGIFGGEFPPGASLRELALARTFGVSQATVREALHRLEHIGLVSRVPNVGTTVTRLSPKDVAERVGLRCMLETMAAKQAAERMSESDFEKLERRLQALGEAIAANRYYEAAQADLEFHRFVWKCSGNETLCHILELVTVPLFAFVSIMRSQGLQQLTTVVAEHSPLLEALRSRDPDQIQAAFERGAVSFYEPFQYDGAERALAGAFGYLAAND